MMPGDERLRDGNITRVYTDSFLRNGDFVMPANHCHAYYEIYYLEQGACRFFLCDAMLDLHSGDLLLIPPQLLYYTRYLYGPCRRSTVYFRREDADDAVVALLPGGENFFREMRFVRIPEFSRSQISALFGRMLGEERIGDAYADMLLRIRLQELLLVMSRVGSLSEELPEDIHTTDRQVVAAAVFMRENYRREVTAAEIAKAAGLSPNYLSRKFRQATGTGVHEYLTFLRLKEAALELLSTDSSVTEIALRCGFSDGNYFKDVFKKRYGVTPTGYRKSRSGERDRTRRDTGITPSRRLWRKP